MSGKPPFWEEECVGLGGDRAKSGGDSGLLAVGDIHLGYYCQSPVGIWTLQ